jgi:membrane protein DedA with SNARE-associated domain
MTELVRHLGALGVFLLMVPESACVPVPSELTLLFAGFAVHQGWMPFPVAVVAATMGNLVGSLLAYAVGVSGVVQRVPGARTLVSRWDGLLERHGTRAVLIARVLPLARTFVSLPAGARRVPILDFIALTVTGCAIWAAGFILLGMAAGNAWNAVGSVVGKALLAVGVAVLLISLGKRHET